jgi:phosphomethylpyrimidine synthase
VRGRGRLAAKSFTSLLGEGDHPQDGGGVAPLGAQEAEAGTAEMSERFRKEGGEIYLTAVE